MATHAGVQGAFLRCPKCKSTDVRYSRERTLLDVIPRLFAMRPVRCRFCRKRFFGRVAEPLRA